MEVARPGSHSSSGGSLVLGRSSPASQHSRELGCVCGLWGSTTKPQDPWWPRLPAGQSWAVGGAVSAGASEGGAGWDAAAEAVRGVFGQ